MSHCISFSLFSPKTRSIERCNLLFGRIDHFGLLWVNNFSHTNSYSTWMDQATRAYKEHFMHLSKLGMTKISRYILTTCTKGCHWTIVSSHQLEIENGRTNGVPREERICGLCHIMIEIEDEYHFTCKCPANVKIREKYQEILDPLPIIGYLTQKDTR